MHFWYRCVFGFLFFNSRRLKVAANSFFFYFSLFCFLFLSFLASFFVSARTNLRRNSRDTWTMLFARTRESRLSSLIRYLFNTTYHSIFYSFSFFFRMAFHFSFSFSINMRFLLQLNIFFRL